ncbi:DUF3261 domain-containing protein [Myxococcota bacterium]|nr:DUF3261 domain-containing protein [Myxococcota bacterium]MCZ7616910.1 DUF3261 domain-containing protein [Myxococcota bacterium]
MADARPRVGRPRRRRGRAGALLLAGVLAAGCRHLPPPLRGRALPECPGLSVATDAMPGEFLVRQRVRIRYGDESWSLQLVAQKRGDELTLLGFHPLGAKLFALRQRGADIAIDAAPAPLLEIPPQNLLHDFYRERFLGVSIDGADGSFRERRGNVEIREQRSAGRVRERRFEPLGDGPADPVVLRFEPAAADADAASRVVVENPACGYRSEITTLSETPLPRSIGTP